MGGDRFPLRTAGFHVIDGFLESRECNSYLEIVTAFRRSHQLQEIHRPEKHRSLRYRVIDGADIQRHLSAIWDLYLGSMMEVVRSLDGDGLAPLANTRAGINVNVMQPGRSEYRWHYDRSRVTAILYLNEVEGGETELYPNYRILLGNGKPHRLQRLLDRVIHLGIIRGLFARKVVVHPKPGRVAVMLGSRCWHSVRPVEGMEDRINIVAAYDRPGTQYVVDAGLDSYLYTQKPKTSTDPNYG